MYPSGQRSKDRRWRPQRPHSDSASRSALLPGRGAGDSPSRLRTQTSPPSLPALHTTMLIGRLLDRFRLCVPRLLGQFPQCQQTHRIGVREAAQCLHRLARWSGNSVQIPVPRGFAVSSLSCHSRRADTHLIFELPQPDDQFAFGRLNTLGQWPPSRHTPQPQTTSTCSVVHHRDTPGNLESARVRGLRISALAPMPPSL